MLNDLLKGLSAEVSETISPPLNDAADTPVKVTNLKTLGSYNWVDHETPTIVIPGSPAKWINPKPPVQLNTQFGAPFFEENIARKCGYLLEPDIRAISITQASLGVPNFDLAGEKIDIVTNRNNLRKLIHFATSRAGAATSRFGFGARSRFDTFRIDGQLAPNGRTMVLTRYESPEQDNKTSQGFIGYDHIFERTCTAECPPVQVTVGDAPNSPVALRPVGYHRIVRYDLLGMRFLVHSRVDAVLDKGPHSQSGSESELDDLVDVLESTHLDPTSPIESGNTTPRAVPVVQVEGSQLQHVQFGKCVSQERLLDVKTVLNGKVKWDTTYPQFFLSQTPNLKIATRTNLQNKEVVTQIRTYTRDTLQAQHQKQSGQFRRLAIILEKMRKLMETHGKAQPLAFVWDREGDIKVYRVEERSPYMSDEGLDKF